METGKVFYRSWWPREPAYLFLGYFKSSDGTFLMERTIVSLEGKNYYVKFDDGAFYLFPYGSTGEENIIQLDSNVADEVRVIGSIDPKNYSLFFDFYPPTVSLHNSEF